MACVTRDQLKVVTKRAADRAGTRRLPVRLDRRQARQVERHRLCQGRRHRRHRRGPDEPPRLRPHRRDPRRRKRPKPTAGPSRARSARRSPPTPSSPSPTGCSPRSRRARPRSSSRAARSATTKSSPPPTRPGWRWSSPACATSATRSAATTSSRSTAARGLGFAQLLDILPCASGTARGPRGRSPWSTAPRRRRPGSPGCRRPARPFCGSEQRTGTPTTIAAAAAQISGQRQPDTGAPSCSPSSRDLAIAAKPSATHSADRRPGRLARRRPALVAHDQDQADAKPRLEREHDQADHHVAVARDVDQRRFADDRGGGDHFGGEQEAERRGAADEARADQRPSPPRPECRAPARSPSCAAMIQKPTWRTCLATAALSPAASCRAITGPRIGSKLVFSLAGSDATCCAT